jgi:death-on-curing protein
VSGEPKWIRDDIVTALHNRQLAEHGGPQGTRDQGLLESALNAPKQRFHYENSSLEELAAVYAFSIAKNHPFVDGNKRTAYICMRLFLKLNGKDIEATQEEKVRITLDLASGKIGIKDLTKWITSCSVSLGST